MADWNNQIQVINAKGKFLRKFGTKGTGPGQLMYPCGVGILSTGNIVVSEYHNHRLQIFTPQGQFVSFVGVGMLTKSGHLCVGPDDDIYVADSGNKRVLSFLPTGQLMKILKTGSFVRKECVWTREGSLSVAPMKC